MVDDIYSAQNYKQTSVYFKEVNIEKNMIIPGQIDYWFGDYQTCDSITGVFEEGVYENRNAEEARNENIWHNIHDNTPLAVDISATTDWRRALVQG